MFRVGESEVFLVALALSDPGSRKIQHDATSHKALEEKSFVQRRS